VSVKAEHPIRTTVEVMIKILKMKIDLMFLIFIYFDLPSYEPKLQW
jgi:hypothetical protein